MFEFGVRRPRLFFAPDDGGGDGGGGDGNDGGQPQEGNDDGGQPPEGGDESELPEWARNQLKKARSEAAKYRTQVRDLEPLAKKGKELEDANKSDLEKVSGERDEHKSRADKLEAENLRLNVALDKAPDNIPVSKIRALAKRLVGSTKEELEADAEELFAQFVGETASSDNKPKPNGKPRESLRGGSTPERDDDDESDPRKLASRIPRTGF